MATRIQIRRDTSTNWVIENPVLAVGELALETDTVKVKCGNGVTAWNDLGYITDIATGNFSLADNSQIALGNNNDLKFFHDGSNSYILDTGTGNLYIRGSAQVVIGNDAGEVGFLYSENGASTMYYDNASRIATTSTGVSVTGNVTATGNVNAVDVNATDVNTTTMDATGNATVGGNLTVTGAVTGNTLELGGWDIQLNGTTLEFEYNGVKKMKLDSSGNLTVVGDITAFGTI